MKTVNVMIVGVGGQGTLLASRILGKCSRKEIDRAKDLILDAL